jgi:SOS-response transcriptional repressor LexA
LKEKLHFSERLETLLKTRGLKASHLAKEIGLSHVAIGNFLNGQLPKSEHLAMLADFFHVTTDYMLGREPEKKAGKEATGLRESGGPYWGTTNLAPVISWASAGMGHEYYDQGEDVRRVATDCKDPNCYALEVDGDSMEPDFLNGDIIIVAPNIEATNGDMVVAKTLKGEVLFKKLKWSADGKVARLIPLNHEYEVRELPRTSLDWIQLVFSATRYFRR